MRTPRKHRITLEVSISKLISATRLRQQRDRDFDDVVTVHARNQRQQQHMLRMSRLRLRSGTFLHPPNDESRIATGMVQRAHS